MSANKEHIRVEDWVNGLLAQGRHAFSLGAIRNAFPHHSTIAIKYALKRLVDKGQIISIHKGYYLIIPPQYHSRGVLPPSLYLDDFMKELDRPYYMGLLSAAAFHGAAHQQPQEFFVVTNFPVLRSTQKKGLKINYISKSEIPDKLLDIRKTESGYLKISNPILTAIDLVQFSKRVGGLNRVTTVLHELIESIQPASINEHLFETAPVTVLQRLGYIIEKVLNNAALAEALYAVLQKGCVELFRTPLKASEPVKGFPVDEKWKVIINTTIETDF